MVNEVLISAFDEDFITVLGLATTSAINTSARINGFRNNVTDALNDEVKWIRWFSKSGTYKLKYVFLNTTSGGNNEIQIDGVSKLTFSQNAALDFNNEKITTIEVARGFHDVHLRNVSDGGTSAFEFPFQFIQFDLIDEHPVLGESAPAKENSATVLLAKHKVVLVESSKTFNFADLDMLDKYSKLIIKVKGRHTTASITQMKVNGLATNYFVDGWEVITSGTLVVKDQNSQAQLELLSSAAATISVETTIEYSEDGSVQEFTGNTLGGSGAPQATGNHWLVTSVGSNKVTSIEIISSVSTFKVGTTIEVYGVKK